LVLQASGWVPPAVAAEALDITRFEAYEGYLDEELYQPRRVLRV
jgi:hypothetical protein